MRIHALAIAMSLLVPLAGAFIVVNSSGMERYGAFPYADMLMRPFSKGREIQPRAGVPPMPGFNDTSEYMMGRVAVSIILPESNGFMDPSTEDWTVAEQTEVRTEIEAGLNWWASSDPRAKLSFTFDYRLSVPVSYEPIIHDSWTYEGVWINETMAQLGYSVGDKFERTLTYINDLRSSFNTDWAFAIFVVDSSNDPDGLFADFYGGYAYGGGPYVVMTYDNGMYGIQNMDWVTAHETGHIFYATDEYNGVTDFSGYLNLPDVESSNCVMHMPLAWCTSTGTRGQIGWIDSDSNGVFDILDVPPITNMPEYVPDPTNNSTPTYYGDAAVVAYPNNNPWGPGNDVTISTIVRVEFSIDSGPFVPTMPSDGAFDAAVEDFFFTTPPLSAGLRYIVAQTLNSEGNVDIFPAEDFLTVDLAGPESSLQSFPPTVNVPVLDLYADATDDAGLVGVELWWAYEGSLYLLYGTDTAGPWHWAFDSSSKNGDGNYTFYSVAIDVIGNREAPPSSPDLSVYVDTVAPQSSVVQPKKVINYTTFGLDARVEDRGVVQSVELYYKCGTSPWIRHSSLPSQPWTWTLNASSMCGDSVYQFYTIAKDEAGNLEAPPSSADAMVIVDTVRPRTTMDPLPQYTNVSIFQVSPRPQDVNNITSVDIWYAFDGGNLQALTTLNSPPWTAQVNVNGLHGDGLYEFYVRATDEAGNIEPVHQSRDAFTVVDTTPPVTMVDQLPEYTNSASFEVTANVSDATGVVLVELWYRKIGVPWKMLSTKSMQPWTWTLDSGALGEGRVEFLAVSTDMANNKETFSPLPEAHTIIDLTPPTLQITAPYHVVWITTSTVQVSWLGTDQISGMKNYQLQLDQQRWDFTETQHNFVFSSVADGVHPVTLRAWDNAGNQATAMFSLKVDTTPPSVHISDPKTNEPIYSPVIVIWVCDDATSGIDHYEMSLNGGKFINMGTRIFTSLQLNPSNYTIVVKALDLAGNYQVTSLTFVVTQPEIGKSLDVIFPSLVFIVILVELIFVTFIFTYITIKRHRREVEKVSQALKQYRPRIRRRR